MTVRGAWQVEGEGGDDDDEEPEDGDQDPGAPSGGDGPSRPRVLQAVR
jgi:hypothetical protein